MKKKTYIYQCLKW